MFRKMVLITVLLFVWPVASLYGAMPVHVVTARPHPAVVHSRYVAPARVNYAARYRSYAPYYGYCRRPYYRPSYGTYWPYYYPYVTSYPTYYPYVTSYPTCYDVPNYYDVPYYVPYYYPVYVPYTVPPTSKTAESLPVAPTAPMPTPPVPTSATDSYR